MPIVVVAAGVAAYKYYENKRQNPQLNLAAAGEDGDGDSDRDGLMAEKDAKPEAPMPETQDYSAGGGSGNERTIAPPEEDEETKSLSSAESLADDGNDSAHTSSKNADDVTPSSAVSSDEQAMAKLTLLQQWNEKYPHLATQQQQPQRGQQRQRLGGPGAFLRRSLNVRRSAPPIPQTSSVAIAPAATSAESTPAKATSAAYAEVWDVLSFREQWQDEKVSPLPPARPDTSRDRPKLPPQRAVSRLARIRRGINGWRGTDDSAAANNAVQTDPLEASSESDKRFNGGNACYPEVWDQLFVKDREGDELPLAQDSAVEPLNLVASRLNAFRRSFRR
mmetsp:Transcript_3959/g.10941  ORF Transcript_3959/g.10941 Transcript_3959/m.10941 type:complete len:335 (-) Transcript_3959:281-1285(-)